MRISLTLERTHREGHFWIERGKNRCGISDCASFPIVPSATKKLLKRGVAGEPQRSHESFLRKSLAPEGRHTASVE